MKRWLFFLAIFLAGLAVLWWIDRGRRPKAPEDQTSTPDTQSPTQLTPVPTAKGQSVSVGADGSLRHDTFDDPGTGKLLSRLTAENSVSLGNGAYRLEKLVVRYFVRGTDQLKMELRADTALARITFVPSFEIDPAYPIQLDGVEATLHEGSPFVPLTIKVPHATGSLAEPTLTSTDHVDIDGKDLVADGVGLSYRGATQELKLERDTQVSLKLEDGTPAKLSARGGLTLTSLDQPGEGATRVVARELAHLSFEGKEPLQLDADEVSLDALSTREATGTRLQPTRVSAHGSVQLTPKDGKFFGNDAQLEFDPEGQPLSARFEGSPRVELLLRDVDTAEVTGVVKPESGDLPVQMIGAGPLVVQIAGTPHFDFHGPATLILPTLDVTLTAQEKLSGTRVADKDFGRLDAIGGVEAQAAGATLTTQELRIERKLTKEGKLAASLSTDSSARAEGPLSDGGRFELTALGGLEFVRLEKSFQVPIAREVDLVVTGPKPMHAKAREIRDLDEATRTLIGTGDVSFENELGRGTGQRVIAHGADSAELFGAPSTPAHLDFDQGSLDAQTLSFLGDSLRAEGDAHAKVGLEGSDYRLDSRWIEIQRHPQGEGVELTLEAGGEVTAHIADPQRTIDLTSDHIFAKAFSATAKLEEVESRGLEASGSVVFHVQGDEELEGSGERLVIDADRSGQLFPAEQHRVQLTGRLPKDNLAFEMTAGSVRFAPESLSAEDPAIEIMGVAAPIGEQSDVPLESPLHAVAGAMSVDPTSILFTEGVYLGQTATKESTWSLDSENLVLTGARMEVPGEPEPRFNITSVLAWGGFQALFSDQILARGTTLMLDREQGRLTLRGDPAEFELGGWRIGTEWIEVDLTTGFWRTAKGSATTLDERSGDLEFRFASMEPMNGVDSRIEVVREPSFFDHKNQRETRAAWALFWLDEKKLESLSLKLLRRPELGVPESPESQAPPPPKRSGFLSQLQGLPFLKGVHEAYFEGNIEVLDHGERRVRADSMYIDFVDGHGWLRGFILTVVTPFRSGAKYLKLHADYLSFAPDASARAKNAVVTSCEFDKPHYVIKLGDLRMKPRHSRKPAKAGAAGGDSADGPIEGYDVKSKKNSVQFGDAPSIPMPEIAFPTDADFKIPANSFTLFGIRGFSIGNIARFGAFLGLTFDVPLGFVSNQVHKVLSKFPDPPEGSNTADVKYLNKRGLLLDGKNSIEQKGVYKLVTRLAVISDTGSDRGLVRVPRNERENLRLWLRMRGRRWLGTNEWFDFNLTTQTDPGVQAEFFQGDYLRWEERETYLHWRRVRGLTYWRGTIETQLDSHRTEVIEEPSVGTTRARGPVASLWGRDIVYSSDTTLAHLRRIEGKARFNELPFPDGFGDEEVSRLDTSHRLERPMPLGVMQARLVPFIEGRATAWDQEPTGSESPSRFALLAGAEASATFWRMYGDGDLHSLTPSVGLRSDIDVEENGTPAQFDGVEDPIDGQFAEFGLRSRWVKPRDVHRPEEEERFLDIELRQAYGEHLSGARPEGWQPLRVNAQWVSELWRVPFGVTHDARYDLDLDQTIYSRSYLGVQIVKPLLIETGFNNARDLAGLRLYSAWSLAARYEFSDKWQIEGQQTLSTLSDSQLDSSFLLRRIGHDFVVELEYSFTAGEGGSSISVKVEPLLTYRQTGLRFLSRLQAQGN